MKKLLSTIGLGIALMTGFATSQAQAGITFVNNPAVSDGTFPTANTWHYDLLIDTATLFKNDKITLSTSGVLTGAGGPADVNWGIAILPGSSTAEWTWGGADIVAAAGAPITVSGFSVTSLNISGPVVWSLNGGPTTGTSGPVPEPATVMLLGIGGLLAGGRKLYQTRTEEITA